MARPSKFSLEVMGRAIRVVLEGEGGGWVTVGGDYLPQSAIAAFKETSPEAARLALTGTIRAGDERRDGSPHP